MDWFTDIVNTPSKALVTTAGSAVAGYIPNAINDCTDVLTTTAISTTGEMLQNGAWMFSILVGMSALFSFGQKQVDRYKSRKCTNEKTT